MQPDIDTYKHGVLTQPIFDNYMLIRPCEVYVVVLSLSSSFSSCVLCVYFLSKTTR